jgi:hypothetical protein
VVFALGSVVMGAANDKETLLIGRIIVGIAIGKSPICRVKNEASGSGALPW